MGVAGRVMLPTMFKRSRTCCWMSKDQRCLVMENEEIPPWEREGAPGWLCSDQSRDDVVATELGGASRANDLPSNGCHQVGFGSRSSRCGRHNVWRVKRSDAESIAF